MNEIKKLDSETLEKIKKEGMTLHGAGMRYVEEISNNKSPMPSVGSSKSQDKKSDISK